MSCCTPEATGRFFSKTASHHSRRFTRRGLDGPQRLIAQGLRSLGIVSRSILEVGCGVGALHLTLLRDGAASATGIELSEGMLKQARHNAEAMGVASKTRYLQGDLVTQPVASGRAEIVILDKVLCCYAEPAALIRESCAVCDGLYAVSYPGRSIVGQCAFRPMEWFGRTFGMKFHPYYHDPDRLDNLIGSADFGEIFSGTTPVWQVKIFRRR